jgi:hypothetical protein
VAPQFQIPIRMVGTARWGNLAAIAEAFEIVGEKFQQHKDFSFADQHRVRHFTFKKNVHIRITEAMELNIVGVAPDPALAAPPPPRRRHGNR